MVDDLELELADRWFNKLNDPAHATYKIANARHINAASTFDPRSVLDQYRKTGAEHMNRLNEAAKIFSGTANIGDES